MSIFNYNFYIQLSIFIFNFDTNHLFIFYFRLYQLFHISWARRPPAMIRGYAEKWSPGKMVPGKNGPREKWSPENWSPEN